MMKRTKLWARRSEAHEETKRKKRKRRGEDSRGREEWWFPQHLHERVSVRPVYTVYQAFCLSSSSSSASS